MKTAILVSLAATVFTLTSCTRSSSGGSVVGNGTIHFHNELYDFAFDYDRSLRLAELSPEQIRISSGTASRSIPQPSTISFDVVAVTSMTPIELTPYAQQRTPDADWKPLSVTGVPGVFHKSAGDDVFDAEYLFLLSTEVVLEVHVRALSIDSGLNLIVPIVDTLSFDTRSPVISEIVFDPPVIKAGETVHMKIHATDNLTAIKGTDVNGLEDMWIEGGCRKLWRPRMTIGDCATFTDLGNGWFDISVSTSPRIAAGDYSIFPIIIWDAAGNPKELIPHVERGVYIVNIGDYQDELPYSTVKIENDNPDVSAPVVSAMHFEPNSVQAGGSTTFVFGATDDDPEFQPGPFCTIALLTNWMDYSRSDVAPSSGSSSLDTKTEYSIPVCGTPTRKEDAIWTISVNVPAHIPAGSYTLRSVSIADVAGNSSTISGPDLTVQSDGVIDTVGPVLVDAKASQGEFHPGDAGSILLRLTDDFPGIAFGYAHWYSACTSYLVPFGGTYDRADATSFWRVPLCGSQFRHVDGDWYAIDFRLGLNIPTGEYWLPALNVLDAVGNRTYATFAADGRGSYVYRLQTQGVLTTIPVVRFRVVR